MQLELFNPFGDQPKDSYWQQGVNDARAGLPWPENYRQLHGYIQGWKYGTHGHTWEHISTYDGVPIENQDADGCWTNDDPCPHCGR